MRNGIKKISDWLRKVWARFIYRNVPTFELYVFEEPVYEKPPRSNYEFASTLPSNSVVHRGKQPPITSGNTRNSSSSSSSNNNETYRSNTDDSSTYYDSINEYNSSRNDKDDDSFFNGGSFGGAGAEGEY